MLERTIPLFDNSVVELQIPSSLMLLNVQSFALVIFKPTAVLDINDLIVRSDISMCLGRLADE